MKSFFYEDSLNSIYKMIHILVWQNRILKVLMNIELVYCQNNH